MAQVTLDLAQRNRLVALLAERVGLTPLKRETMLDETGLAAFRIELTFDAEAATFAAQLVRELQARGTLPETGQPALVSLLRWLREEVAGQEAERAFVTDLLLPYQKVGDPTRPLKLFVSYRRRSWPFTGRLADELRRRLNAEIFVDYEGVDATDFEQSILGHLRASDGVLLVVEEHTFSERIQSPGDWVRREIEEALALGKPIVQVGVDGRLPVVKSLPPSLQRLARMQSIPFYPLYWEAAVEKLVDFLAKVTTAEAAPPPPDAPAPPPDTASPAEPPPPQPPSPWETLRTAQELLENGDFEKGIFLLEALRDQGFRARFLDLAQLLADATSHRDAAQRAQQAREEYEEIAVLARSHFTLGQARAAWASFREAYPDYTDDPAGLAETLKAPARRVEPPRKAPEAKAAPTARPVARPTAAQQALLDVMLDPKRPPAERAEAGQKLAAMGDPRPGVGLRADGVPDIAWVRLEGGDFPIGGDEGAYNFLPKRTDRVETFSMAKYPVTNAQWEGFLRAKDGYGDERWWREVGVLKQRAENVRWREGNHPRASVNWYEVVAFCLWLSVRLGYEVQLPTEEEWERAARGKEGRLYPWGPKYVSGYANIDETYGTKVGPHYLERTSPVGIYPPGATPEGICDLAGNVWEWTASLWDPQKVDITAPRVLRGGSWYVSSRLARSASRYGDVPAGRRGGYVGFRVVALAPVVP